MLFDTSPHIQLTKEEQVRYVLLRIALIAVFLCGGLFFAYIVLFPTIRFHYDSSIDSLANTITDPAVHAEGTVFYVSHNAYTDTAHITITTQNTNSLDGVNISLKKSYIAFLTPITLPQEKQVFDVPYPSGSLLSSSQGIFITDNDTIRAFDTEETFLAAGYSFDNVQDSTSDERSSYKKAKIFAMDGMHPNGTIFETSDTNKLYLYQDGSLSRTDLQPAYTIKVAEDSRSKNARCALHKSFLSSHTYTCTVNLSQINPFPGKDFQIIVNDMPHADIAKISLAFRTALTQESFKQRLTSLSQAFHKKY